MTFELVGREPLLRVVRRSFERRAQRHRHLYLDAVQEAKTAMAKLSREERESLIDQLSAELSAEERARLREVVSAIEGNQ